MAAFAALAKLGEDLRVDGILSLNEAIEAVRVVGQFHGARVFHGATRAGGAEAQVSEAQDLRGAGRGYLEGVADCEPMPGRKMRGCAILANPLELDRGEWREWLPAKSKPAPKKKGKPRA